MATAFAKINVDGTKEPLLCHAADSWIKKRLPKDDPVHKQRGAERERDVTCDMRVCDVFE
jgi:hypothetical protein